MASPKTGKNSILCLRAATARELTEKERLETEIKRKKSLSTGEAENLAEELLTSSCTKCFLHVFMKRSFESALVWPALISRGPVQMKVSTHVTQARGASRSSRAVGATRAGGDEGAGGRGHRATHGSAHAGQARRIQGIYEGSGLRGGEVYMQYTGKSFPRLHQIPTGRCRVPGPQ